MRHYIDIHLQQDPEFPLHLLMSALYAKLHRALAQLQLDTVGVSFPGYQKHPPSLGRTLRLLGPESSFQILMDHSWLHGMRDHVVITQVTPVPDDAVHRCLRRIQPKSSPERLRRRRMRRHQLSEDKARELIPDTAVERVRLPFVTLTSGSTGQTFPVFFELSLPSLAPDPASEFNSYGLSRSGTIPCF